MKHSKIHHDYINNRSFLDNIISNFDTKGDDFGNQKRNSLKLFDLNDEKLNVKSFKIPNIFNQIAYKFFRNSKAERSYEYANKLLDLAVGTPKPIAFYEFSTSFLFGRSFYISEHLDYDFTFRELTKDLNYPDHEKILRLFTRFTFELHEKGIHFLDHSPGNTLIKKMKEGYKFYLVDLNRMEFKTLTLEERVKNFSRLTKHESIVKVMSDEYAKCLDKGYKEIFGIMWGNTQKFQKKFHRKKRLKKKLFIRK